MTGTITTPELSGSYGCFVHPSTSFERKRLNDPCPECGRPYNFPLTTHPLKIRDYTIEKPLGRGFYGVIYLATSGPFKRQKVLKVIPEGVYSFHNKDFAKECSLHYEVAAGTDHVVGIGDYFEADVAFGDLTLRCHVAVLDYVQGAEMDEYLASGDGARARTIAQLAIDILRLLQALERKSAYHNDLHHRNLIVEQLPATKYRPEAIDETVRLVAVDLGSLADRSRSGPPRQALGDLRSAAAFLVEFAVPLLKCPDQTPDSDYRLASTLVELAALVTGESANIRTPDYDDFITQIRQAYIEASSPWRPPAGLTRLNDAYNAQTLHPCFVPRLLVDPGGEWLAAVSTGGPQVITGVRGCGKTMLLRALQFHARLSEHIENADDDSIVDDVQGDGFVGLYRSARRLLDARGDHSSGLHEPYARLLVGYAREGVRAARHLAEEKSAAVRQKWWEAIGRAITEFIDGADEAGIGSAVSPEVLERRLQAVLFSLDRGESTHHLATNPAIAFPAVAEAIRDASPAWDGCKILFLLDDVSTRHLEEASIAELLGTLLFSDDHCAFKLTTEGQTLELALKSPGLVERARADRDYEPFDLAARVNEKLKHAQEGKRFLADILKLRANQFKRHPKAEPAVLLGDTSLENIGRHIVATGKNAGERKKTYWGLSALTAVCVGDIGDVLNIYDSMLRKAGATKGGQIPPNLQNEAFQAYASRRLYHLNRRAGALKDSAMSFAKAAHELLQRSARPRSGAAKRQRLRQYAQVYVRITTGDQQAQFERLRELIDAGVFVLESGADSPRKKTRDADPVSQFILTYRKLFGLTQYIGLAFSDRFELSGDGLQDWLFDPANGKEVLMRNLGGPLTETEATPAVEHTPSQPAKTAQLNLLANTSETADEGRVASQSERLQPSTWATLQRRLPFAREVSGPADMVSAGVRTIVLGLGFEERCLASASELLRALETTFDDALLIRYQEKGHSDEIEAIARQRVGRVRVVEYDELKSGGVLDLPSGPVAVDVTGLAKPVLFHSVRQALLRDQRVVVVHTQAAEHYPLDAEVAEVFPDDGSDDVFQTLERASRIWSGEMKPYSFKSLLASELDDSRPSLLCAAASAKHERLISLMDERTYDAVDIVAPESDSNRARLARLAADVATRGFEASKVSKISSNDLTGIISFLAERFRTYYLDAGFGIEFGLTGSKMHAVACAVASTAFKLAQVWYVSPSRFDPERFTRGVGATRWFIIERSGE